MTPVNVTGEAGSPHTAKQSTARIIPATAPSPGRAAPTEGGVNLIDGIVRHVRDFLD
jgi:hypothetical protein